MSLQRTYKLSHYGNLLLARAAIGGKDNLVIKVGLLVDTGSSYTCFGTIIFVKEAEIRFHQ